MRRFSCHFVIALLVGLVSCPLARAAPFVNLNFEQATVPPGTPPGTLPASVAFPGWTPRIGETVLSSVYYNHVGAGEGAIVLYDRPLFSGNVPVSEGMYSAYLYTDAAFGYRASLSQLGDVPVDARSVRFLVPSFDFPPQVFVNGLRLPTVRLSTPMPNLNPVLWGVDITTFTGQKIDLRFSSGAFPSDPERITGLDAVRFSSDPIPEPIAAAVVCVVGLAALRARGQIRLSLRRTACEGLAPPREVPPNRASSSC